MRKPREELQWW